MMRNLFSAAVFMLLAALFLASGAFFVNPALSSTGTPPVRDAVREKWPQPVYDFSRNLWDQIEYALFHQSRKGVLIGDDRWLFSDSFSSCPAKAARNLSDNLDYIVATRNLLAERNTTLLVILIPAKGRLGFGHHSAGRLPSCRRPVYGKALDFLGRRRVPVADLLAVMRDSSATGMRGAELIKGRIAVAVASLKIHNGDLMQYEHDAPADAPKPVQVADAGTSLTDGVRLYNANGSFGEFLKEVLRMDLLNVAGEGQGPFMVMDKYLRDAAWRNNPPDLLVWEIPERYLLKKRSARN
jgi:alginate O-acetyltransferase complex protein AlgJ